MKPRIAILGFFGENTVFRSPVPAEAYEWMAYHDDAISLIEAIRSANGFVAPETVGFFERMDETGPWQPVPILYAFAASGPQLAETHLAALLHKVDAALEDRGPFDGVYISGHGSFVAEKTRDTDGALLERIRAAVGPAVPVIETLDLHGQVTTKMLDLADLLIAYRTDPHIDNKDRGREAADGMRRLLLKERVSKAYIRLPIMIPTVAIVAPTSPFPAAVDLGQARQNELIANVSILPGYPFTDSPHAGLHILVQSWDDGTVAAPLAEELARFLWEGREGFQVSLMSVDSMIENLSSNDDTLPRCFADIADNPGGGGTGNTTRALEAILKAKVGPVAIGPFFEPSAAAAAHAAGLNATLDLILNKGFSDRFVQELPVRARVVGLADGRFNARRGVAKGVKVDQGLTAALQIEGATLVVTSTRLQALAVEQFEMVGVDLAALRGVVLKSRGHYQASFSEFFSRECMIPIDTPGWMSPHLQHLEYRNVTRPIYPLDCEVAPDFKPLIIRR